MKLLTIIIFFASHYVMAQSLNKQSFITPSYVDSLIEREKILTTLDSAIRYEKSIQSIEIPISAKFGRNIFLSGGSKEEINVLDFIVYPGLELPSGRSTYFYRRENKYINCLVEYWYNNPVYDKYEEIIPELTPITYICYKYYFRDAFAEFYILNDEIDYADSTHKWATLELLYQRHKLNVPQKLGISNFKKEEASMKSNINMRYMSFNYFSEVTYPNKSLEIQARDNYYFTHPSYLQTLDLSTNALFFNRYVEQIKQTDDFISHPSFFAFYVRYGLPPRK